MPYPFVNEPARLQALHDLKILDTPPEDAFNRLTQAAKDLFDVPHALVTFVDADRAWIKAGWPVDYCEAERKNAICNYTILHDTALVLPNILQSKEFRNNPYVRGEPYLRFYAGVPLTIAPDIRVGTLCLLDTKPRNLNADQVGDLHGLARVIIDELWLRQTLHNKGNARIFLNKGSSSGLSFTNATHISGEQVRAARALLDWTIVDLAKAAHVSINTIKRLESCKGGLTQRTTCNECIRSTFEAAGVNFFGETGVALLHAEPEQ